MEEKGSPNHSPTTNDPFLHRTGWAGHTQQLVTRRQAGPGEDAGGAEPRVYSQQGLFGVQTFHIPAQVASPLATKQGGAGRAQSPNPDLPEET